VVSRRSQGGCSTIIGQIEVKIIITVLMRMPFTRDPSLINRGPARIHDRLYTVIAVIAVIAVIEMVLGLA